MRDFYSIKTREYSEWVLCPFGLEGGTRIPVFKGHEPNRFHRFMQRLCFGFVWMCTEETSS